MKSNILWINNPDNNFQDLNTVGIGYGIMEDLVSSNENVRLEKIKQVLYKHGKSDRLANSINSFFSEEFKYAVFPTKNKILHFVELQKPYFDKKPANTFHNKRRFTHIGEISNTEGFPTRPGICHIKDKNALEKINQCLNSFQENSSIEEISTINNFTDSELIGYEGKAHEALKNHKWIERDRGFINRFKNKFNGINTCEKCSFDPQNELNLEPYEILELHHITPLSKRQNDTNSITNEHDIKVLCPNCHRAVHRYLAKEYSAKH